MKKVFNKVLSLSVVFSMLVMPFAPVLNAAPGTDLAITCDSVVVNGNVWTVSGTWHAYDFPGQPNQYDAGVSSPSGTYIDESSKDAPDLFTTTLGPSNYINGNQDDMAGTWSNQITFASTPNSISAALYHGQTSGGEISADSTCTFVLPPKITLQKEVINDNGGNLTDTSWTLAASGPSTISGVEGNATITNAVVGIGTYTLSETGPAGYTPSLYSCIKNGGSAVSGNSITLISGDVAICTITNNDNPTSTPPSLSGVPATATIPELDEYTFTAAATDSDVPEQTLTFSLVGAPAGATIDSDSGEFSWTPTEAQGPGVYPFSVRVSDGSLNTDASLTITVTEVNVDPNAVDDEFTTAEDVDITISLASLLSNDSDSDLPANTLTITAVTNADDGSALISGSDVVFSPDTNFNGTAGFDYTLSDGTSTTTGHVKINVTPINDAPNLDTIPDQEVNELTNLSFNVTAVDIDAGDGLTYSISAGNVAGMTLNSSNGEFSWTPTEVQGPATYSVTIDVTDEALVMDSQTFTITVNEVNESPVANDDSVSTSLNDSVDVTLAATDSDIPTNALTYTVGTATNGTVDVTGNVATYTPNDDFTGSDSFDFEVCDEDGACDTATISITVSNDAPVMNDIDDQTINELETLSLSASATDSDPLTYSLSFGPSGATVDSTGQFSWTPTEAQGPGIYLVTIAVTDGVATDSKTFNVTVNEVNEAPVATDDNASTNEDTPVTIILPNGSDSDIPSQALAHVLVDAPMNGSAFLSGNSVQYTPNANYFGTDTFTYKLNDGVTDSNIATITITVDSINDLPVITLNGSDTLVLSFGSTYSESGATADDVEDGQDLPVTDMSGAVDTSTAGTYTITYNFTDTSGGAAVSVTRTITVSARLAQCADGIDNDGDQKIDMQDPGCSGPTDDDETDPIIYQCSDGIDNDGDGEIDFPSDSGCTSSTDNDEANSRSSSGGGGQTQCSDGRDNDNDGVFDAADPGCHSDGNANNLSSYEAYDSDESNGEVLGEVLGAETTCGIYVDKFLRKGYKSNNSDAVGKVQQFLNDYTKAGLVVDKIFGSKTEIALKSFQFAHKDKILTPWNLKAPTGIFYLTTQAEVNNIMCPTLNIPVPTNLIPFSDNPAAPKV